MHETPDPSKPKLKKVSGVYIHAALAERLLREIPARLAAREAAKAKAAATKADPDKTDPDARKRKGISQLIEKAR